MKSKLMIATVLALSLWLIGNAVADDSWSNSGEGDVITVIQQQSALDISAFLQVRPYPPMEEEDMLMYMDISPNPYGDDVMVGWTIQPAYDYGSDSFGFVYENHLVGADASGMSCFIGPLANPATFSVCLVEPEITFLVDLWSPPTFMPLYWSCFWESFRDGEADNWVPTDPSWYVDDGYRSEGTGIPGWRGSYYARIYDATEAGITYSVQVEKRRGGGSDNEQVIVFFADPVELIRSCYAFSIKFGPPATYTLRMIAAGEPTNLIDPTPSNDIDPYSSNNMKVVVDTVPEGLTISLYINGAFQASVIDDTPYTSGVVGIGIHDKWGDAEIAFDSILLHRLTVNIDPPPEAEGENGEKPKRARGWFGR